MGETALTVKIVLDADHDADFGAIYLDRKAADKNLTKEDVFLDWIVSKAEEMGERAWRELRRDRVLPVGRPGGPIHSMRFEDLPVVPDGIPGDIGYAVEISDIILPSVRRATAFIIAQSKAMGATVGFADVQGFCNNLCAERIDDAAVELWKKRVRTHRADRRTGRESA